MRLTRLTWVWPIFSSLLVRATWTESNKDLFGLAHLMKTRQRHHDNLKCSPFDVEAIHDPHFIEFDPQRSWSFFLALSTQGAGIVDLWLDLDGSGRFEGLSEYNTTSYKKTPTIEPSPGRWELVSSKAVKRSDENVNFRIWGDWGEVVPLQNLHGLIQYCPTICFNRQALRDHSKCKKMYFQTPIVSTDMKGKIKEHQTDLIGDIVHQGQQVIVPDEILDTGDIDTTVGIVIGSLVAAAIVTLACSWGLIVLWRAEKTNTNGRVEAGETAESRNVYLHRGVDYFRRMTTNMK